MAIVYLVDDENAVRDSLSVLIETMGFTVQSHESAAAFLRSYDPERPGCLILDVRMPEMSGLELQEELLKRDIAIPIVFISGNAEIPESAKAFRAGAIDFLEKPFDQKILVERIREGIAKDIQARTRQLESQRIQACFDSLSPREKEVLQLIISSHSNKEAAKKLDVSHRTIDAHRAKVMDKMQADSIAELVAIVMSHALLPNTALRH